MSGVVTATGLQKRYHVSRPPRQVLSDVSLRIHRGEFVALMGPSGSGKSTLLHILGGLEPPDAGSVIVDGTDIYALDDERRSAFRREHIGFVFQFFNLISSLTAAQNVALPLQLRGRRRRSDRQVTPLQRAATVMSKLNLHGLQGHGPDEISGGEQQRVAIARALVAEPDVLLADEPTGNLDWTSGHDVMSLLDHLCATEHQTMVVVTHDARVAAYADRVLVMRDGSLVDEVGLDRSARERSGRPPDPARLVARLETLGL